jgi:hypothetical protein
VITRTSAPSVRCRVMASQKFATFTSYSFVSTLPRMGNQKYTSSLTPDFSMETEVSCYVWHDTL